MSLVPEIPFEILVFRYPDKRDVVLTHRSHQVVDEFLKPIYEYDCILGLGDDHDLGFKSGPVICYGVLKLTTSMDTKSDMTTCGRLTPGDIAHIYNNNVSEVEELGDKHDFMQEDIDRAWAYYLAHADFLAELVGDSNINAFEYFKIRQMSRDEALNFAVFGTPFATEPTTNIWGKDREMVEDMIEDQPSKSTTISTSDYFNSFLKE